MSPLPSDSSFPSAAPNLASPDPTVEVGPDPVALLRALRARLGLSRENLARLLGCSPRALSYWESGTQRPKEGTSRTIVETARLIGALGAVLDVELGEWLLTPQREFGGLKPIEIVERGESGRLWGLVFQLRRQGEVAPA